MKRALFVLVATVLLAAGSAGAVQNVVTYPDGNCYNTTTGQRVDCTTGAVLGMEQYPDRNAVLIQPALLSSNLRRLPGTSSTVGQAVDSSSVVSVLGFTKLALMVYWTDSLSCGGSFAPVLNTIALQTRWHMSATSDSISTFILHARPWAYASTTAGVRDSLGSWRDVIDWYAAGPDSIAYPNEQVVLLPHHNGARGRIIPIMDRNNNWQGGDYMSIRWRPLNAYGGANYAAFGQLGFPGLRIRADLVGWR